MILSIILLAILLGISVYINYNLFKRTEQLEQTYDSLVDEYETLYQKMVEFEDVIKNSNQKLKEIDYRGAFESDDEVGFFFKELKGIQEEINEFLK
jgi:hypothetical protein